MKRSFRWMSVAALVAAPVVVGVAAPAGARPAATRFGFVMHARPAAVPNSNVKGKGATLKYAPAKISAHWSGPPPTQTCTNANEGLTITNTTKKTVQPTSGGSAFGAPLKAHQSEGVCGWGTGRQSFTLGLQGSAHTLTLKFS